MVLWDFSYLLSLEELLHVYYMLILGLDKIDDLKNIKGAVAKVVNPDFKAPLNLPGGEKLKKISYLPSFCRGWGRL